MIYVRAASYLSWRNLSPISGKNDEVVLLSQSVAENIGCCGNLNVNL